MSDTIAAVAIGAGLILAVVWTLFPLMIWMQLRTLIRLTLSGQRDANEIARMLRRRASVDESNQSELPL